MRDKSYETLRLIAMLIAPIGAFLSTLMGIWGMPYAEPICLTVTALDVLFGSIVEILRNRWKLTHPEIYQTEEDYGEE